MRFGGWFSGEHGDGQSKAKLLPRLFCEQLLGAFRDFKTIWDPDGGMNPGKIVDPWRPIDNLRLGTHYNARVVETHFRYPKDGGRFNRALLRCVGIGNCRQQHGDTMCPSYRATREEMHSTRGRARLLFEMMAGDVLRGGFREPPVQEALDLASRARTARATVRCRSTWRRTRRSSSRATTRAVCAGCAATCWDISIAGRGWRAVCRRSPTR